jgi:chromosome segregation ATPase
LEAETSVLKAAKSAPGTPTISNPKKAATEKTDDSSSADAKLKFDLAEALRSKGQFEARLRAAEEELKTLRVKTKADTKSLKQLQGERQMLSTKLRDREHELREKRKLVEDVQDEMITLNLQLNMVEKERDKVKKENRELIDRFMRRVAQEADAMNLANEPIFEKGR